MPVVLEALLAFIINGPGTWGSLEWGNHREGLAILLRANLGTEYKVWILQKSHSHSSNRNNSLSCDLFTQAIPSVLQRALLVVNLVATFFLNLLQSTTTDMKGQRLVLIPDIAAKV